MDLAGETPLLPFDFIPELHSLLLKYYLNTLVLYLVTSTATKYITTGKRMKSKMKNELLLG